MGLHCAGGIGSALCWWNWVCTVLVGLGVHVRDWVNMKYVVGQVYYRLSLVVGTGGSYKC